jgi:hypothetical protein
MAFLRMSGLALAAVLGAGVDRFTLTPDPVGVGVGRSMPMPEDPIGAGVDHFTQPQSRPVSASIPGTAGWNPGYAGGSPYYAYAGMNTWRGWGTSNMWW